MKIPNYLSVTLSTIMIFLLTLALLPNWKAVVDGVLIIPPHTHEKHISYDQHILSLTVVTYKCIKFIFKGVCPLKKENHAFVYTNILSELKRQKKKPKSCKLSWAVKVLKNETFKSQIYNRDNR